VSETPETGELLLQLDASQAQTQVDSVETIAQAERNWHNCEEMAERYRKLARSWAAEYLRQVGVLVEVNEARILPEEREQLLDPDASLSRWIKRVFGEDAESDDGSLQSALGEMGRE